MFEFDVSTTLGTLVTGQPQLALILEETQIDYCCCGDRSLAWACEAKGLDADAVASRLAGGALNSIRELGADFCPPDDACNTWRVLLHGLLKFECTCTRKTIYCFRRRN